MVALLSSLLYAIGTTIVSLIIAVVVTSFTVLITTDGEETNTENLNMIGTLIPNILIPTLLALTLRVALKKSQSPEVPPLPQFYENANTRVDISDSTPEQPPVSNQDQPIQLPHQLEDGNGSGNNPREGRHIETPNPRLIFVKPCEE